MSEESNRSRDPRELGLTELRWKLRNARDELLELRRVWDSRGFVENHRKEDTVAEEIVIYEEMIAELEAEIRRRGLEA